ncbi:FAD-binding oxidoreductase [Dermabacter vaginalis]|uniref:FAD-binding oxidoreductase n=1 Tax=Dermabacter vaginalis TaxID=1630135 RepID=UPI0021A61767|nr:FAD-binding oxidoreductase [Dermabacter vaginalis]MCT2149911.1 FAD-binding oxidoreductase [Dermabacter vaginalis]
MNSPISAREVKRHKWWGWGLDDITFRWDNKPAFPGFAKSKIGMDLEKLTPAPEPQLSDYEVPSSRLGAEDRVALAGIVGEDNLLDDDEYRVVHSFGRSVIDLFRARTGDFARIVDAVIYPKSDDEVQQILTYIVEHDLVAIPYGGGSSISGSVTPNVDEKRPIITINLGRMREVISIDDTSGLARVDAGVYGPDLEEQLNELGWTMGHFPDSFTYSTLGGWAATRSTGMQSDRYGDIEDIVRGLKVVRPDGIVETKPIPGRDSGSSIHEMILGSEGRLGIITECTVRVHRMAENRVVIAYMFPDWESGIRGMHAIARSEVHPVFTRLSDGPETAFSLSMLKEPKDKKGEITRKIQDGLFAYLRKKGWDTENEMCMSYVCFEGSKAQISREQAAVKKIVKKAGGITLGAGPGAIYDQKKFDTPYLRDFLLGLNVFGDVSDTGTTWARINEMHSKVYDTFYAKLEELGIPGFFFCHMSHSYHQGACLYFTFAVPYANNEVMLEQYTAIKHAVQSEFQKHAGTLSHHHAVGTEHQPWIEEEVGPLGVKMMRDLYETQDPGKNLNPGKIVS